MKCVTGGMAKLPLEFHPDARLEALEAYDWYAERSQRVAYTFHDELQGAGRAIEHNPERWESYLLGTHRYLMKRFPYVIVYRVATDRVEILAVAHGRRKPGFWKERLETD
ncbi:type II toxin-antitoxin system RelE/ParE family toxin [Rosistilla oblonga]|uniref:type II toxin-antitoxin system RelE/ParE family toxin n=1 Tax=Rosistilla oblonga TaxID=2527990 RepID=UPI003A97C814